jgi:thioesterase domain-containing protein
VVVPHAFGGVALFARALVGRLPDETALLVVQSNGLSGGEPDTSLDAMAERYALELREAGAPRPVVALGFCMGTSLAVAIAREAPGSFDAIVLVDPGRAAEEDPDPIARFAYEQIPEQHRPSWDEFTVADRDARIELIVDAFTRKGIPSAAATSMATRMYRVWDANAACRPVRDLDVVPEHVSVTVVSDEPEGVRERFGWTRKVEILPMRPRAGERFTDLDLESVAAPLRSLLAAGRRNS